MPCQVHSCCTLVDDDVKIFASIRERKFTDIWFLCFGFFPYLIGMITIGSLSLANGNVNILLYPRDYKGQFCGGTSDVASMTKAYYPRLDKDLSEQMDILRSPTSFFNFQPYTLCVSECPEAYSLRDPEPFGGSTYPGADPGDRQFYAILGTREIFSRCLPVTDTKPAALRKICAVPSCQDAVAANVLPGPLSSACYAINGQPDVDNAWEITTEAQDQYCTFQVQEQLSATFYPEGATAETRAQEAAYAEYITSAFSVLAGIVDNRLAILCFGVLAPYAFSGVWFVALFFVTGLMVLIAIVLLLCFLLVITLYLYYKAGWADEIGLDVDRLTNFTGSLGFQTFYPPGGDLPQSWYSVLAIASTVALLVYLILLCVWRKMIYRCIAIVRQVTKVLCAMPMMCVWPLLGTLITAGIFTYFIAITGLIVTSDISTFADMQAALNSTVGGVGADAFDSLTNLDAHTQKIILFIIHAVGCLWGVYMVEAGVYTTLARGAAVWYFNHAEENGRIVQKGRYYGGIRTVIVSAWVVLTRHLGTISKGAAVLTVCTIVKFVLHFIDEQTETAQQTNCMLKLVMKCAHCAIWCFEKTIKFISYFGFIFVAIDGGGFCGSCWKAMSFTARYPAQIMVNKAVAHILSLIISLSIPCGCAMLAFVYIDQTSGPEPFWCTVIVFVTSFFIAAAVTDVLRCCIDTIFLCSFKDMEEHSPPKYMPQSLMDGFGINPAERQRFDSITSDPEGMRNRNLSTAPQEMSGKV